MEDEITERKAFLARVEVCLERNLFQAAHDMAQIWLQQFPGDVDAKIALCHAWIKLGRLDEALEILSQVEDIVFRLSRIYVSLGDICEQSGLAAEAMRYYRRYIYLNPGAPDVQETRRKLVLLEKGRKIEGGEEEATEEDELAPDFYTVTMADLYIRQGHLDMAERVLEKIGSEPGASGEVFAKLDEIRKRQREKILGVVTGRKNEKIITELQRWLDNLLRTPPHAV